MLWPLTQQAMDFQQTCWDLGQDFGALTFMSLPKSGVLPRRLTHGTGANTQNLLKTYTSLEQQMEDSCGHLK